MSEQPRDDGAAAPSSDASAAEPALSTVLTDERLGVFDAVMWNVEQDPVLRSVIVVMVVLDTAPDLDVLRTRMDAMARVVPKLRQRVVGNPMSLVPPRWETDPYFDFDYHVRRLTVSGDGTWRPALAVAESMAEQDFDRKRPLWETAVVSGLPDGRVALVLKIHHAVTDGVGGMAMAAVLFDLTREPAPDLGELPQNRDTAVRSPVGRLLSAAAYEAMGTAGRLRDAATATAGFARDAVVSPVDSARSSAAWLQSASRLLAPASKPLSPTMRTRSLSLRFASFEVSLDDLKRAGKAGGGTVNDAFMGAVAGGLRLYHVRHGEPVGALRVNMPVNVRTTEDGSDAGGNRWVPTRFPMPVDEPDAQRRLELLGPLLRRAKNEPALALSDHVYRLLTRLPAAFATNAAGSMMKGTDVAATNVPGPPVPIYLAGGKVESIVAFAPKAGAALNVALMSYDGRAVLGVNLDLAAVPDPDVMLECLRAGFEEVLTLGRA
jgi:WS/DGAT/MGAT family acyltransferase